MCRSKGIWGSKKGVFGGSGRGPGGVREGFFGGPGGGFGGPGGGFGGSGGSKRPFLGGNMCKSKENGGVFGLKRGFLGLFWSKTGSPESHLEGPVYQFKLGRSSTLIYNISMLMYEKNQELN